MTNDDKVWRWDESQAVESVGDDAQKEMDALLMKASGSSSVEEAESVLLGRPRAEEARESTVKLQVRVPISWQREIDRKAGDEHMSRSQYLRHLISEDARKVA
ncbi:hypothetical protein [uncultured Bifidobacterium sp.]|uniref:hypothetical protein n=1 Tax=uncultured Bifidobacterium sp. TaxID=165187 RepID=UPI0028DB6CED|nr:hypothetical protein [uncultured Bifidobacterium sp.]